MDQHRSPDSAQAGWRVVILLSGLVGGGAERHALDLVRRLRLDGFDTRLMSYGRNSTPRMVELAQAEGVVALGIKGMSSLRGWLRIREALQWQDGDVIICVNQTVAVVALALRLLGQIKARIICIFHTTVLQPNDQARFFLFRWLARFLDMLVYVSPTQKRYWDAQGLKPQRDQVIVNGVDFTRYRPDGIDATAVRRRYGIDGSDYLVGIVAGLRPEKNHEELVDAIGLLRQAGHPAKLLIVGEGACRTAIEARVAALSLESETIFVGEQDDVRPYILACDVCVLCSSTETFSLSTLETLALGVPMVSSRVGGQGEIIVPDVNGRLYPAGDAKALAADLADLSNPALRSRLAGAARASVLKYDQDRMAGEYRTLIEGMLGRGPS